jgi:hypothetical protein
VNFFSSYITSTLKLELFTALLRLHHASASVGSRPLVIVNGNALNDINEALQDGPSRLHFSAFHGEVSESKFVDSDASLMIDFNSLNDPSEPLAFKRGAKLIIDGNRFFNCFLASIQSENIYGGSFSCRKTAFVYAALTLTSYLSGPVFEGGVYFGGNTTFMFRVLERIGIHKNIFSFDTFTGMPAPLAADTKPGFIPYVEGTFAEATFEIVISKLKQAQVPSERVYKTMVDGNFQYAHLIADASLAILDMDSYEGMFHGVKLMADHGNPAALMLVDDTSIGGVNLALNNICTQYGLSRVNLTYNFDLICRPRS